MKDKFNQQAEGAVSSSQKEETQSHFGGSVATKSELEYRESQRQAPAREHNLSPDGSVVQTVHTSHHISNEMRIQYLKDRLETRAGVARDDFTSSASKQVDQRERQEASQNQDKKRGLYH